MLDAQAWYARDLMLGCVRLPSVQAMQLGSEQWREKELAIETDADSYGFQSDYIEHLISMTDYPEIDVAAVNRIFLKWKADKKKDIMGYRDKVYRSVITGTQAVPHHTRWMQAMDDSLASYLQPSAPQRSSVRELRPTAR